MRASALSAVPLSPPRAARRARRKEGGRAKRQVEQLEPTDVNGVPLSAYRPRDKQSNTLKTEKSFKVRGACAACRGAGARGRGGGARPNRLGE